MASGTSHAQTDGMTARIWAILLGWVLVRLVAGNGDARTLAAAGQRGLTDQRPRWSDSREEANRSQREPERGRQADKPTEIPAQGWKDILWRVYERFTRDRIMLVAAGVTFYTLLALFPGIAALVSLYGLFADPGAIQTHLNSLSGVLPGGAQQVIGDQVQRVASKGRGTLGSAFAISLVVSLWSANAGIKSLFDALNIVYGEEEKRSFIRLNALSLAFTFGSIIFLLLALGALVVVPVVINYIGLGKNTELLLQILRWPALLLIVIFGLALLYRYGPSRDQPKWRWVTPGSMIAAVLWLGVSMLFSWYVSNFGTYNETYGSLGAVIGFMTWIWLSTMIVLLGAEINAELEHQTARDTTQGAPEPPGGRGARMADTVGAAKS
jgi:membrane protein